MDAPWARPGAVGRRSFLGLSEPPVVAFWSHPGRRQSALPYGLEAASRRVLFHASSPPQLAIAEDRERDYDALPNPPPWNLPPCCKRERP
jgi:hypothetical protein